MLNKLLTFVVAVELFFLLISYPVIKSNKSFKYSIDANKISNLDEAKLENYIIGVVAAEMPATFSIESLKAQAVAARTFSYKKIVNNKLDFDNLSTDKGQAYLTNDDLKRKWGDRYDEYYDKVSSAVLSTKGEIITYNGDIINAYYFSLSNGKTENSSSVFGEAKYLVSVESPWDVNNSSYSNIILIDIDEFKSKLNLNGDLTINEINKSDTNHVNYIVINNKKYDGISFRKLLNLRSTDFDVDINNNKVTINTRGYGHGVGMSQYGANSMANEGKNYIEILKYYYQGVELSKI